MRFFQRVWRGILALFTSHQPSVPSSGVALGVLSDCGCYTPIARPQCIHKAVMYGRSALHWGRTEVRSGQVRSHSTVQAVNNHRQANCKRRSGQAILRHS